MSASGNSIVQTASRRLIYIQQLTNTPSYCHVFCCRIGLRYMKIASSSWAVFLGSDINDTSSSATTFSGSSSECTTNLLVIALSTRYTIKIITSKKKIANLAKLLIANMPAKMAMEA